MVKLIVVLTALQIASVTSFRLSKFAPTIKSVGHGGVAIKWAGFFGIASMGRFITGMPTDGGVMIKVGVPTGGKALAMFDAGLSLGGVYAHLLVGSQSSLGSGISVGVGGRAGLFKIRWGAFAASSTGATMVQDYHVGNYAANLLQIADGFLKILDANNVAGISSMDMVQANIMGKF